MSKSYRRVAGQQQNCMRRQTHRHSASGRGFFQPARVSSPNHDPILSAAHLECYTSLIPPHYSPFNSPYYGHLRRVTRNDHCVHHGYYDSSEGPHYECGEQNHRRSLSPLRPLVEPFPGSHSSTLQQQGARRPTETHTLDDQTHHITAPHTSSYTSLPRDPLPRLREHIRPWHLVQHEDTYESDDGPRNSRERSWHSLDTRRQRHENPDDPNN
ncbi:uncharacterized protein [Watersipora subatra]|uniref:uncharacterized protein n=1 Tax=Watersipora subatra TaxID=2589382 RepID=UPI00355C9967